MCEIYVLYVTEKGVENQIEKCCLNKIGNLFEIRKLGYTTWLLGVKKKKEIGKGNCEHKFQVFVVRNIK